MLPVSETFPDSGDMRNKPSAKPCKFATIRKNSFIILRNYGRCEKVRTSASIDDNFDMNACFFWSNKSFKTSLADVLTSLIGVVLSSSPVTELVVSFMVEEHSPITM